MSWPHLLLGPVTVGLLFAGWLAVQALWRRAFNLSDQADALAERPGCASCPRSSTCPSEKQTDQRASGNEENGNDR